MKMSKTTLALALTTTIGAAGTAVASENPFDMHVLGKGYMVADAGTKAAEGKCGAGKSGEKAAEGKCGAGKSGEMAAEGMSGAGDSGTKKAAEGKCGEGKCGASRSGAKTEGSE